MKPWDRFADVVDIGVGDVYQFAVLVVLAHHWNKRERLTWPSPETIAKRAAISERKVKYALRKLESAGWITSVGSRTGGRGKSIRYRLNLPCLMGNPAQRAPFPNQKPCTHEPETMQGTTVKSAQRAPEPLRTSLNQGAVAPAREAQVPRRSRTPNPNESADEKRRRQWLDLADDLRVTRQPSESDGAFIARVQRVKAEYDQRNGLQ